MTVEPGGLGALSAITLMDLPQTTGLVRQKQQWRWDYSRDQRYEI